ncbi:hypothetical protein [Nonomuraea sp. NPDC049695]|uniref:hypothetical protein n=1 Tax=Nonomuraea sp. NPDC049695 TaxID=3154734 RepID=UPI00343E0E9D
MKRKPSRLGWCEDDIPFAEDATGSRIEQLYRERRPLVCGYLMRRTTESVRARRMPPPSRGDAKGKASSRHSAGGTLLFPQRRRFTTGGSAPDAQG